MNKPFLVLAATLVASAAHAQTNAGQSTPAPAEDTINTDRPDFTDSPDVVGPNVFQIESGYTYTRSGKSREHSIGEGLLRMGMGSKVEWQVGLPNYLVERDGGRTSGFDDLFLGGKFVFGSGQGSRPATAILVGTTVPTGAKSIGENGYQPQVKLALSWDLSDKTDLGLNLGYARPRDGGQRFDQAWATASLGHQLTSKWGSYFEVYGLTKVDATGKSGRYVDTGVSYLINPNLQVDARVGLGLFNRVGGPDYFTGAGVSRRF